jgi:hypothetical protein
MPTASFALQKAIHAALTTNPALLALLGGPRVHDDVPRGAPFPYVTFAHSIERDWSTGGEEGHEHIVTLHVWSRAAGSKEAQEIIAAIRSALHDQPLTLSGHRLVNLRQEFSEVRRDADGETYHGLVRLRAVTEPAT